MRTTILGHPISMPIGISPTSLQGFAHYDREVATAIGKIISLNLGPGAEGPAQLQTVSG